MSTIDTEAEWEASQRYYGYDQVYRHSKGWFSCDSVCTNDKYKMEAAKYQLDLIEQESTAKIIDAKRIAGVFSEIGVGEARDSFWTYFAQGKAFAKRQTMWDAEQGLEAWVEMKVLASI